MAGMIRPASAICMCLTSLRLDETLNRIRALYSAVRHFAQPLPSAQKIAWNQLGFTLEKRGAEGGRMTSDSHTEQVDLDDELAQVISSETTIEVLVYLVERSGSPREIADSLGISTSKASHHVKKLARLNMAELVEERDVGGTIQHFYRAVVRPIISTKAWKKLSIDERQRYSVWIVRMILADAANSFKAKVFDARTNTHLSRTPLVVDAQGLTEVAEIQRRALLEIIDVEATAAARAVESGGESLNVIAAMMCFELPAPSRGVGGSRIDKTLIESDVI
ncbi:MAG TPA: winged helix-turn-helix domain-containing protein [Solirubrobacterales bacterium]|jgi:predicted transcriptional regulator